jgi:DNA-directed RNA polymerase specialized sigma24 family protein
MHTDKNLRTAASEEDTDELLVATEEWCKHFFKHTLKLQSNASYLVPELCQATMELVKRDIGQHGLEAWDDDYPASRLKTLAKEAASNRTARAIANDEKEAVKALVCRLVICACKSDYKPHSVPLEDATQEVIAHVAMKIEQGLFTPDPTKSLSGYVTTIVKNKLVDIFRQASPRQLPAPSVDAGTAIGEVHMPEVWAEVYVQGVLVEIEALPLKQRLTLKLDIERGNYFAIDWSRSELSKRIFSEPSSMTIKQARKFMRTATDQDRSAIWLVGGILGKEYRESYLNQFYKNLERARNTVLSRIGMEVSWSEFFCPAD